jgi:hypothetical protein
MAKIILTDNAFGIAEKKQGLQGLANVSFKIKNNPIKERVVEEKRTEVLQIKLTPSEKKKFSSLIGDETGSDIGRFLIKEFIKNNS